VVIALLFTACTTYNAPVDEKPGADSVKPIEYGTVVYSTDSDEWHVYVFASGVLYGSGYNVDSPYHIPTKTEAQTLRHLTYGPSGQRYVTCDGYTYGMPSASVTQAGAKTKYSVMGLWRRRTVIDIPY
jgi:hypothetical protein